jgi:hypothetical protein
MCSMPSRCRARPKWIRPPARPDMCPEPGATHDRWGIPIPSRIPPRKTVSEYAPPPSDTPGKPPAHLVPGIDYIPSPAGMSADAMRYWIALRAARPEVAMNRTRITRLTEKGEEVVLDRPTRIVGQLEPTHDEHGRPIAPPAPNTDPAPAAAEP